MELSPFRCSFLSLWKGPQGQNKGQSSPQSGALEWKVWIWFTVWPHVQAANDWAVSQPEWESRRVSQWGCRWRWMLGLSQYSQKLLFFFFFLCALTITQSINTRHMSVWGYSLLRNQIYVQLTTLHESFFCLLWTKSASSQWNFLCPWHVLHF